MTRVVFPTLDGKVPDARGILVAWLVADGAHVRPGQLIAEVRVGRAAGQIAAPADGVLRHRADEGMTVRQGRSVAIIE